MCHKLTTYLFTYFEYLFTNLLPDSECLFSCYLHPYNLNYTIDHLKWLTSLQIYLKLRSKLVWFFLCASVSE